MAPVGLVNGPVSHFQPPASWRHVTTKGLMVMLRKAKWSEFTNNMVEIMADAHSTDNSQQQQDEGRLKVLYIHGLGASIWNRKGQALSQQFDLCGVDMPRLKKLKAYAAAAPAVLGAITLAAGLTFSLAAMTACAVSSGCAFLVLKPWVVRREFKRCLKVQREAIQRFKPDVVVGTSLGGAVAVELAREGAWSGPLVLMCPAYHLVHHHMSKRSTKHKRVTAKKHTAPCLVVHGDADTVVPVQHSRWLAEELNAGLTILKDVDHRFSSVPNSQICSFVQDCLSRQEPARVA